MTNALSDVRSGMSYRAASLKHGIPRITLMRKHKRNLPAKTKMGPKTSFSEEQENMLAYWIITMSKAGFPLSKETFMYSVKNWQLNITLNLAGKQLQVENGIIYFVQDIQIFP